MKLVQLAFLTVILFPAFATKAAEDLREINWESLLPKMMQLDNPFESLNTDQLVDLETIVGITKLKQNANSAEIKEALDVEITLRRKMEKRGLDVDTLIQEYLNHEAEIIRRNRLTNKELDGQLVRMPGYALPLEHKGLGVTDLLLVPYVGACIHVPPPPPNQIIYVTLTDPYKLRGLYEPVWITGRLLIEPANKSLFLVDGSADIPTSYTLKGVKVERYEE